MVLLINVGNSNIHIGLYDYNGIIQTYSVKSLTNKTSDEYFFMFDSFLKNYKIENVIIASVVPIITSALSKMIQKYYQITPMIVGNNLKTGLKIIADDPKSVGGDLVCAAVGAMEITDEALVIEFGTATKYLYIKNNQFLGAVIAPGISLSMNALINNTALLPNVELVVPKKILGNNTISCIQSGVIYGSVCKVDGMIDRIKEEVNNPNLQVIATGNLSKIIIPQCRNKNIIINNSLVFNGLINIFKKNLN